VCCLPPKRHITPKTLLRVSKPAAEPCCCAVSCPQYAHREVQYERGADGKDRVTGLVVGAEGGCAVSHAMPSVVCGCLGQ
jgi:hypothetical protein